MTTVAVSKNKRSQVLFRTTPPLQDKIIIAFDHESSIDDSVFLAQVVDESLALEVEDVLEVELAGEIEVTFDDTTTDITVCGQS